MNLSLVNTLNTGSDAFENFSFMVIEEFLKKKGMQSTLASFKEEYSRPTEEQRLLSWYAIIDIGANLMIS